MAEIEKKKADDNTENIPEDNLDSPWKYVIWIFFVLLFIYYIYYSSSNSNNNTISYTELKKQINNGNVSSVLFDDNSIIGDFKNKTKIKLPDKKDSITLQSFSTVKPPVNDPGLITSLEKNNVTITAKETSGSSWVTTLLIIFLPSILIIVYFVFMRKRIQEQFGSGLGGDGLFGIGKSKAKRISSAKVKTRYSDVAGLENAKKDLQEIVDYLKNPNKFKSLGADIPKGILLMGPPGTGKTMLAKATAGEANVPFYSISGSEFIEMFVGVGASRVRDLFNDAKKNSPSIIFIDEIDSVGRARGTGLGGGHDEREQTLNQILSEMDGFESNESVLVMAATNRPDVLDPALTRPGRFDRRIVLDFPLKKARLEMLKIHTRHVPLASDVNLENIAARTVGFSGADIKNLVNEAALYAGRRHKPHVEAEDFDSARDKILLGSERDDIITDEEKQIIAYHEAGHALTAKLLPNTDPLQKVTIIPRGRSLGATEVVPEFERHNLKREYLLNKIAVALGGRAAEKIIFNDISNGAESDLKYVTGIARRMVCQWGMSDRLGPIAFKQAEEQMFLAREITQLRDFSDETARIIDEEVQKILFEMENKAINLLQNNREKLDALADALIENETLDDKFIENLFADLPKQLSLKFNEQ